MIYTERIRCNYKGVETDTIKQRMFNDDYLRQVVEERIDELIAMTEKQLRSFLAKTVWVTMDYYNVDLKEIKRHLKEEWKKYIEWRGKK